MLGINSHRSLINVNFVMVEFILFVAISSGWLFIIFDASDFREFTCSIASGSTLTMTGVCFTIFATKKQSVFALINITEQIIENSEKF